MRQPAKAERVKLPRVNRVRKGGRLYKYHRRTGAPLPSDVPEDHPAFIAAWTAQEAETPPPRQTAPAGTIAHGVAAYIASPQYRALSDSYRPVIYRHVDQIARDWGAAKMADLRTVHVEADMADLKPAVARSRRKAWRKLGPFWKRQGWVETDHTIAAVAPALPKSDGHKEWTAADVARFRAFWPTGTRQRRAMELLQWTGARISDVVKMGRGMVREGRLEFRQTKGQHVTMVPWATAPLGLDADHAACMAEIEGCTDMIWLLTEYGKPRSVGGASQWFSDACTKAGLPDLSAHGLRKYRLNQIAEAGGTVLLLQTWGGHVTVQEVEHYTRRADRIRALEQNGNLANRVQKFANGDANDL